jgi:hypothetical protein
MHDLDDYNEPSNNTTSESIMSNATTSPTANGPVATNLLGQFNAAANDDSVNLTNNTTLASDESSENSFSDIVTSFDGFGHGGKRKRKIKGGKKTRKHKKRGMRGGVRTWAQLPQQVEERVFMTLPREEQAHYSHECFHIKNANASTGDQKMSLREAAERTRAEYAAAKMQNPKAKISEIEYRDAGVPPGWVRVVTDSSAYHGELAHYRRRVAADDELDQIKKNIQKITTEKEQILKSEREVSTGRALDEASIPKFSIRTDRDAYITLPQAIYNRYQVLSNLLEEEEAKKSRLERQLERL